MEFQGLPSTTHLHNYSQSSKRKILPANCFHSWKPPPPPLYYFYLILFLVWALSLNFQWPLSLSIVTNLFLSSAVKSEPRLIIVEKREKGSKKVKSLLSQRPMTWEIYASRFRTCTLFLSLTASLIHNSNMVLILIIYQWLLIIS